MPDTGPLLRQWHCQQLDPDWAVLGAQDVELASREARGRLQTEAVPGSEDIKRLSWFY